MFEKHTKIKESKQVWKMVKCGLGGGVTMARQGWDRGSSPNPDLLPSLVRIRGAHGPNDPISRPRPPMNLRVWEFF